MKPNRHPLLTHLFNTPAPNRLAACKAEIEKKDRYCNVKNNECRNVSYCNRARRRYTGKMHRHLCFNNSPLTNKLRELEAELHAPAPAELNAAYSQSVAEAERARDAFKQTAEQAARQAFGEATRSGQVSLAEAEADAKEAYVKALQRSKYLKELVDARATQPASSDSRAIVESSSSDLLRASQESPRRRLTRRLTQKTSYDEAMEIERGHSLSEADAKQLKIAALRVKLQRAEGAKKQAAEELEAADRASDDRKIEAARTSFCYAADQVSKAKRKLLNQWLDVYGDAQEAVGRALRAKDYRELQLRVKSCRDVLKSICNLSKEDLNRSWLKLENAGLDLLQIRSEGGKGSPLFPAAWDEWTRAKKSFSDDLASATPAQQDTNASFSFSSGLHERFNNI